MGDKRNRSRHHQDTPAQVAAREAKKLERRSGHRTCPPNCKGGKIGPPGRQRNCPGCNAPKPAPVPRKKKSSKRTGFGLS